MRQVLVDYHVHHSQNVLALVQTALEDQAFVRCKLINLVLISELRVMPQILAILTILSIPIVMHPLLVHVLLMLTVGAFAPLTKLEESALHKSGKSNSIKQLFLRTTFLDV